MRKLLFIVLCASSISTWAQTSISDCDGAIVLCGDLYTETQASFNTGNVIEATGSCNQGLEQSSVWYTFTVQADGNLSFILDPINDVDDYDFHDALLIYQNNHHCTPAPQAPFFRIAP